MSECANVHVRTSILNPGLEVTPLKFRGWIREQARDIDAQAMSGHGDHHHSLIVLFLPKATYTVMGQARLDKILQDVTDRFHTVTRIELRVVDRQLTMQEVVEEQMVIQEQLAGLSDSSHT